ncbi:MAG: preprotein translocase subunit SecA, partial [Clostridia bacterium]|nr:preprotein translocase subunit SecA [Clostridia bacterium]
NFAIVDEVDSILIDEARTPLIISGRGDKSNELYIQADRFAKKCKGFVVSEPESKILKKTEEIPDDVDFTINEKERTVMLTDKGVAEAEKFFKVDNLTDIDNIELNNHIQQALKANYIMKRDINYIVSEGEVLIVDEFTGRVMIGRRFSEGLHQAIEAKEHVAIRDENRTIATITFQNFFRMYKKLSGMTGTAKTEEDEFKDIYSLDVVTIPSNKPSRRFDEQDQIYTTVDGKITAIVQDILDHHATGQPILVGTVSVEKSENLSKILNKKGIYHHVLNAKNHKQESAIIAQAGKLNSVTIATNMAGRGTDIMLGGNPEYQARQKMEKDGYTLEIIEKAVSPLKSEDPEVIKAKEVFKHHYDAFKANCDAEKEKVLEAGGLHIIGTERHESRRIDNQLRGRAGRQGDPGSSVFYISLEDDIARIFGGDRLKSVATMFNLPPDEAISNKMITKQIEKAQRMVEGRNYAARKQVLSYDDVINAQREIIYKERAKVLDGLDVHDQILDMIDDLAEEIISAHANYKVDYQTWDYDAFNAELEHRMLPEGSNVMTVDLCSCFNVYKLKEAVMDVALKDYEAKAEDAKENGIDFGAVERLVLLKNVDAKWIDHIESMDVLRRGIGLRGLGQRDPVIAYRQEGWDMFDEMVNSIHTGTASALMKMPYYSEVADQKRKKAEQQERARNAAMGQANTRSFVRNKKK